MTGYHGNHSKQTAMAAQEKTAELFTPLESGGCSHRWPSLCSHLGERRGEGEMGERGMVGTGWEYKATGSEGDEQIRGRNVL